MAEAETFGSFEEMAEAICKAWTYLGRPFESDDIVLIGDNGDDDRIGWKDVRYVCIRRFRNEVFPHPQCIGYCTFIEEEQAPD